MQLSAKQMRATVHGSVTRTVTSFPNQNFSHRCVTTFSYPCSLPRSRYLSRHATLLPHSRLLKPGPHSLPDLSQSQLQCHFRNLLAPNSLRVTRPIIACVLSLTQLDVFAITQIKMAALNEGFRAVSSMSESGDRRSVA